MVSFSAYAAAGVEVGAVAAVTAVAETVPERAVEDAWDAAGDGGQRVTSTPTGFVASVAVVAEERVTVTHNCVSPSRKYGHSSPIICYNPYVQSISINYPIPFLSFPGS